MVGRWVAAVLIVVLSSPGVTRAQRAPSAPGDSVVSGVSARTSHISPVTGDIKHLGRSLVHVVTAPARWDGRDWLTLPLAGAGLAALAVLDGESAEFMRRRQDEDLTRYATEYEHLGTAYNFGILAGFYAAGLLLDDVKARMVAMEGLASSAIAAAVITPTLQYITGRHRPRASEDPYTFYAFSRNISFPSGHTTQAFAVASVIATEYDALWIKTMAYGLAGVVGLCRMYDDAHYLSDVTAAALIGTAVGRSVAHFGQSERRRVTVQPAVTPSGAGVGLTLRF
ncbi:MAG: phosphatase PAP2 family protein [Longimicrobiales bacterium]